MISVPRARLSASFWRRPVNSSGEYPNRSACGKVVEDSARASTTSGRRSSFMGAILRGCAPLEEQATPVVFSCSPERGATGKRVLNRHLFVLHETAQNQA